MWRWGGYSSRIISKRLSARTTRQAITTMASKEPIGIVFGWRFMARRSLHRLCRRPVLSRIYTYQRLLNWEFEAYTSVVRKTVTREQIEAIFWTRIDRREPGQCWNWTGCKSRSSWSPSGYGQMRISGKMEKAHRVSWFLRHGVWPTLLVLHRCDNPSCVNPEHLFEGTNADNSHDREMKGRGNKPLGEKHHQARFTAEQVQYIRSCDKSSRQLGREYGVSKTAIQLIRQRVNWAHI